LKGEEKRRRQDEGHEGDLSDVVGVAVSLFVASSSSLYFEWGPCLASRR